MADTGTANKHTNSDSFYNNLPIFYVLLDHRGKIKSINKRFTDTLEFTESLLLGKSFDTLLSDESSKSFNDSFDDWLKSGKIEDKFLCIKCSSGKKMHCKANGMLSTNGNAETMNFHLVFENITKLYETQEELEKNRAEIQKVNKKLKSSESRYEAMINSSTTGISTMSLSGYTVSINPTLEKLSGYAADEIIGKHFINNPAWLKKDIKFFSSLYTRALKDDLPEQGIEFQYRHKSGEVRWGEAYLNTIKKNGKVSAFQASFIDITDRKRLEEFVINDKEEKLFLFEAAQEMLLLNSKEDLFKYYADKLYSLLPKSILICNDISENREVLTVKEVRGISPKLRAVLKVIGTPMEGTEFNVERDSFDYALQGKLGNHNNSIFDLSLGRVPEVLCEKIEKAIGLLSIHEISLGTSKDIIGGSVIFLRENVNLPRQSIESLSRLASMTLERLNARQGLDESERLFRTITENSPDLIIRCDTDFEIKYLNSSALKIFSEKNALSSVLDIHNSKISDKLRKIWADLLKKAISEGTEQRMVLIYKKDEPVSFDWIIRPELDSDNNVYSLLLSGRDVTRGREKQAIELQNTEIRNKIYSVIAHDLRGPLSSMIGFVDLLSDDYRQLSDEKRLKYLDIIKSSAGTSVNLLNSLLDWAASQLNSEIVKLSYFDIDTLIENILRLFKANIDSKQLSVRINYTEYISVYSDYNIVFMALRNIFSNAIKFSRQGGEILIDIRCRKALCEIGVDDNGVGMSKNQLNKLFDQDTKISTKGTEGELGLGLGLRLTKDFLSQIDAELLIDSVENKGSSVKIVLPQSKNV